MNSALILEDHADSRRWLQDTLQIAFPGIRCVATGSLTDARAAASVKPDLALVDLNLPDGSGIDLIRELRGCSDCVCVVTTIYDDDQHLFPALRAGAAGYVLKEQSREEIASLLRGIASGAPPLSPAIARRLLQVYTPGQSGEHAAANLTEREREVLSLIAKGYRIRRAAEMLGISEHTCQGYVKSIYRKLEVSSRAEATLEATRLGIVSPD